MKNLTKKHYQAIASIYASHLTKDNYKLISQMVNDLCVLLIQDNPKFDRSKFLTACGL
jgi:dihydroneopterin aldolase